MTALHIQDNQFTLINVFKVDPSDQQRLVDLLTLATEQTIIGIPGFIASILHRSMDGTKVTMYAQWKSLAHYQEMRKNPQASPYLEETLKIASFEPGMYEVVRFFKVG
jgi:quinol monooxygenase YgiN